MEAILLDTVPAGMANPALPAGNASASSASNSPFASLLAKTSDATADDRPQEPDGRAAADASGAAALLAMLLAQPQDDAAQSPEIAIGAADLEPSPESLALGLNSPETAPDKANGLTEAAQAAAEMDPLPDFKQDRGENAAAKTLSLSAAVQAQPATSTPLPAELIEDTAVESNGLELAASKAQETPAASKPVAPVAAATDEPSTTEATKPAPQPQAREPAKPTLAEAMRDDAYEPVPEQDRDPSSSVTTPYPDRQHSLGASTSVHTVVEKLANLIGRPDLLAAHIERAVANGRDRISVALVPADLGRIDISLDFERNGKLSAVIAVDRVQTLELLRRDQYGLERALQEAGFRTDSGSLSFNLRGEQRQHNNPAPWAPARDMAEPWQAASRSLPTVSAPARLVADGRLDIEV